MPSVDLELLFWCLKTYQIIKFYCKQIYFACIIDQMTFYVQYDEFFNLVTLSMAKFIPLIAKSYYLNLLITSFLNSNTYKQQNKEKQTILSCSTTHAGCVFQVEKKIKMVGVDNSSLSELTNESLSSSQVLAASASI